MKAATGKFINSKAGDTTMKNKTLRLLINFCIISAICFFCSCSPQTGVRSGQVLNAVNNEPIQGAVVAFSWRFSGVLALGPIGGKYYETLTDKDGKYIVPNQTINKPNFMYGSLVEQMLVYKDGYSVYAVDLDRMDSPVIKPIGYPDDNQAYHKENNIVKLYPWKDGESHELHKGRIDGLTRYSGEGELLKKELAPERKRADEEMLKKVEEARKHAVQERAKKNGGKNE
jgi:hypothetical protein